VRIGVHLGPFWVSTRAGGRRRRRSRSARGPSGAPSGCASLLILAGLAVLALWPFGLASMRGTGR
jgi:hypothetical protein